MRISTVLVSFSLIAFSAVASAGAADYGFSIYGAKAKKFFNSSPKITASCSYSENKIDANGNETDTLKLTIKGEKINSILCRQIGEVTYACEASTAWFSNPCEN